MGESVGFQKHQRHQYNSLPHAGCAFRTFFEHPEDPQETPCTPLVHRLRLAPYRVLLIARGDWYTLANNYSMPNERDAA